MKKRNLREVALSSSLASVLDDLSRIRLASSNSVVKSAGSSLDVADLVVFSSVPGVGDPEGFAPLASDQSVVLA